MRTIPRGLITTSTTGLLPIAQWTKRIGFDSVFDQIALTTIKGYQKFISPHKGFNCAHKSLHGGDSCSQYFRRLIAQQGLSQAIPLFQQRLDDCKLANIILKAEQGKRRKNGGSWDCDCEPDCDGCEPECDCG